MELKDVKIILKRIQVNYPNFIVDSYVQSEWYRELKDYCLEDVMQKLEQHFRSEQYGNSIPKVYFLKKYLRYPLQNLSKLFYPEVKKFLVMRYHYFDDFVCDFVKVNSCSVGKCAEYRFFCHNSLLLFWRR